MIVNIAWHVCIDQNVSKITHVIVYFVFAQAVFLSAILPINNTFGKLFVKPIKKLEVLVCLRYNCQISFCDRN